MKTKPVLYLLLAAVLAAPSLALAVEGKAPTTQQQRMKSCNAEAKSKSLKGDERRNFMSSCLKGEKPSTAEKEARRE